MVGQHDAAGAHAMVFVFSATDPNDNRSRGARNAGHVVMLGHPIAIVAKALSLLCEVARIVQGVGRGRAFGDGGKIENGR